MANFQLNARSGVVFHPMIDKSSRLEEAAEAYRYQGAEPVGKVGDLGLQKEVFNAKAAKGSRARSGGGDNRSGYGWKLVHAQPLVKRCVIRSRPAWILTKGQDSEVISRPKGCRSIASR